LPPDADAARRARNAELGRKLLDLAAEVLFLDDREPGRYHPRSCLQYTRSFADLDGQTRERLNALYVDFFYRRNEGFWREQALTKLPAIRGATRMLICGEDLGMVPDCVGGVMHELGILSLYIQRMPKDPRREFHHPADSPYLSVCTTSSHDMSTVRAWWEEDRGRSQRFFNQVLGHGGTAPFYCEPWICREIVVQHLHSPAMWAIFPLQDLLAMDDALRRSDPREEQINVPSNPRHYWKYRMHLNLEDLLEAREFNESLRRMVADSGR
jgi:4-alpha-glucanotransferase